MPRRSPRARRKPGGAKLPQAPRVRSKPGRARPARSRHAAQGARRRGPAPGPRLGKPKPARTPLAGGKRSAKRFVAPDPARVRAILEQLRELYPDAKCALDFRSPLQLLVATILSAQCTDERVNKVTPALFAAYPDAAALAAAEPAALEKAIHSTGFFRNKAKSIRGAARMLVDNFGGEVPSTMEELLQLPGVARKTANVVLGTWFKKASGVVVDTHVHRVARRLQLTREEDPKKIERDLMGLLPQAEWINFSHRLIWHGRKLCAARKPKCDGCPLAEDCPSAGKIA